MRIGADGQRGTVPEPRTRVDSVGRNQEFRRDVEIRGRIAEPSPAALAADHHAFDLGRTAEETRRRLHLSPRDELSDPCRGDTSHQRHGPDVESEPCEQRDVPGGAAAEAEVLADDNHVCADPAEHSLGKHRRLELRKLERERQDEHLVDPGLREELETPLECGEEWDSVPEDRTRMGPERHDRGRQRCRAHRLEDAPVSAVHAVEAPERDGALARAQLRRIVGDVHNRASASSGGMIRSVSASSTENGPISVLRSVRQWPPSASATART